MVPKRGAKLFLYSEIYLEKDKSGKIISFLECVSKERGVHIKFPTCSHKFIDKGLLYNIYYNKEKHLFSWKQQQRKVIEFVDRFEIKSNLQQSP